MDFLQCATMLLNLGRSVFGSLNATPPKSRTRGLASSRLWERKYVFGITSAYSRVFRRVVPVSIVEQPASYSVEAVAFE
ncbi:hypothetical protein AcW2_006906 [Taiwanofungus camphoratus]|nr:hypothetical protein AcW2_006906 [Antrodia cinnamomea]